jgi:DNA-binding FrmR family transcriptional regulator
MPSDTAITDEEVLIDARLRLRRIQGQVGGIAAMLDEGRPCREVIQQVSAASKALSRVGLKLLVSRLEECLAEEDESLETKDQAELERLFLSLA